ncbi:MAG TPA: hypothetical protein VLI39_20505, partial [Sedimentisphaerales bacterium]|nr:hypothetical protein [Sedimentisphaerales bacterium]
MEDDVLGVSTGELLVVGFDVLDVLWGRIPLWSPRPAGVVVGGFCGNEDCWRSESVAAEQEAVAMKKRTVVLVNIVGEDGCCR